MVNTLFLLKLCPKCGGDLTGEADHWGRYLRCFQCGFNRDEEVIVNAEPHKWTKPDSYGRRSTRKTRPGPRHQRRKEPAPGVDGLS